MTRDPDDDALRWEGDDDPTLAPGWKAVGEPVRSEQPDAAASATDSESGATAADGDDVTDADAAAGPGSAELVLLGVLGGIYLLYAIGWLITAIGPAPQLADPVAQFMYGLGRWLAVLAPAFWLGAVLWLLAEHRRARLLWLIAGAVLLVPVPFLLRG
ncbi:DNA polymerase III subunit gamma/tau [Agromyces sp. Marseille-P2726]|uniref:DNA polymerase III subunit gamma/tau n=1 Tax=Agromyces sp. Marseille-P2726 TaxID=2709132 RepID=UPI00156D587E|nr:DNA polymerase III subunit gamma/tau [Agromyces sp. Marseille-P2726]